MDELNFIKKHLSDVKCGCCGEHCDIAAIEPLGHYGDTWLFSVHCPSCDSRGLITVDIKRNENPGADTDLTETEKNQFSIPVDLSDILEMHIFLKDFDGDFVSLFTTSSSSS